MMKTNKIYIQTIWNFIKISKIPIHTVLIFLKLSKAEYFESKLKLRGKRQLLHNIYFLF